MEFTDDEIREELARLGYRDVPDDKLVEFKKDLMKLIQSERSKSNSLNSSVEERNLESVEEAPQFCEEDAVSGGNDWKEKKYIEDWAYSGRNKTRPATAGPTAKGKKYTSGSYGLFEQPIDLGLSDENQNEEKNNSRDCVPSYPLPRCFSEPAAKQIKRKTARPASARNCQVYESDSDSDAAGLYELYERVRNLAMRDCECNQERPTTSNEEPPYRIHGVNRCPSLIRNGEPPHTRNLVKTLPWKRHQMYERLWKAQPNVGEDNHKRIRRETHARCLHKEEIKMPRKVFKPNKYVPPTENPRYKLRWEVRLANALYEMPSTNNKYQGTC